jgi:putative transposase
MPRIPRLIESGSYYHVLTRGNDRKRIFISRGDFLMFLKILKESRAKYPIVVSHYCIMNNHVHLLVKAMNPKDFSKFFQILLQRYAHQFRKRYHPTGFLYQNRYKSYPIEKESYLLDCARYIERNPVRAGIVKEPGEYEWSSYKRYAFGKKDDIIIECDPLYERLAESDTAKQRIYQEYVTEERPYEVLVDKGLAIR